MRKSNVALLGHGARGMAFALASMLGAGMVSTENVKLTAQTQSVAPIKAPAESKKQTKVTIENTIGGIPMKSYFPDYGLSPKEYGMRYGHGGSMRSNRLRYSHNAKLKRRKANA